MGTRRSGLRGGAAAVLSLLLSCGGPPPTASVAAGAAAEPPSSPAPEPVSVPVSGGPPVALTFAVDPARSVGTIDTILDPDGVTLGPRPGRCQVPLRGTIKGTLQGGAAGRGTIRLTAVSLATTRDAHLHYEWSVLLGEIHCTIPGGSLTITDHALGGPAALDGDRRFRSPVNRFSVRCPARIRGSGLVLGKAVGAKNENLDIPVTGEVPVSGSCERRGDQLVLRIPGAVLRDHFDLGDAGLALVFTGDITATCPAP